jgi:hypothetical protein
MQFLQNACNYGYLDATGGVNVSGGPSRVAGYIHRRIRKKVVAVEAHGMKGHGLKDVGSEIAHGSIAQMFALVAGVILTVAGVLALIVNADFHTGAGIVTEKLLFMDVNGWSGLLMLLTGVVLVTASRVAGMARKACVGVGVLYLVVTVWSLFTASVIGMFPVNDMTAIVYAAIGVLGVTAGLGPDSHDDAA